MASSLVEWLAPGCCVVFRQGRYNVQGQFASVAVHELEQLILRYVPFAAVGVSAPEILQALDFVRCMAILVCLIGVEQDVLGDRGPASLWGLFWPLAGSALSTS
ncbi:MAG: hypothetical protein ABL983_02435 [Nitrospira sp.]